MKTKFGIAMTITATCITAVMAGCRAPKAVYEWGDGRRATVEGANQVTFSDRDKDGLSVVTGDREQLANSGQNALAIPANTQPSPGVHADNTLRDQVRELQGRHDQLQETVAALHKETEQARAEVAAARKQRDRLLAEIKADEVRLRERQEERRAEEKAAEAARHASSEVLAKLDARRAEVDQAQHAAVALNRQIEQLGTAKAEVEAELAALVTARDEVQVDSAEVERELDALRGQVKTLASEKTAATEALAVVRAELAEAKEKLTAAGAEIRQREQRLRQLDEPRRAAEQVVAAVRPDEHLADVVPRIPQAKEPAETSPPSVPAVPEPVEETISPALIDSPQAWWSRGLWLGLVVAGLTVMGVVIFSSRRLLSRIMPDVLTVGLTEFTADGSDYHRMQIDRTQGLVFDTPPRVLPVNGAAQADLPWIRRGAFSRLVLAGGADGDDVNLNGESLNGSEAPLREGDRITIGQDGSRRVFVVQVAADEEPELLAQESETL